MDLLIKSASIQVGASSCRSCCRDPKLRRAEEAPTGASGIFSKFIGVPLLRMLILEP